MCPSFDQVTGEREFCTYNYDDHTHYCPPCSGHGVCDHSGTLTGKAGSCDCDAGWSGEGCHVRSCPPLCAPRGINGGYRCEVDSDCAKAPAFCPDCPCGSDPDSPTGRSCKCPPQMSTFGVSWPGANNCSGHGRCAVGGQCVCNPQYG